MTIDQLAEINSLIGLIKSKSKLGEEELLDLIHNPKKYIEIQYGGSILGDYAIFRHPNHSDPTYLVKKNGNWDFEILNHNKSF